MVGVGRPLLEDNVPLEREDVADREDAIKGVVDDAEEEGAGNGRDLLAGRRIALAEPDEPKEDPKDDLRPGGGARHGFSGTGVNNPVVFFSYPLWGGVVLYHPLGCWGMGLGAAHCL